MYFYFQNIRLLKMILQVWLLLNGRRISFYIFREGLYIRIYSWTMVDPKTQEAEAGNLYKSCPGHNVSS